MRTFTPKPGNITREWWVIDGEGQTLGRLASEIAKLLRGKHKPYYTPFLDTGDFVIVVNSDKIHVTGKKNEQQVYYRHSGYPGGLKALNFDEMMARNPQKALELAVKGMLPKNRLGDALFGKLKVYAGPEHPHAAQQPKQLEIVATTARSGNSGS
ncbi:MAG: 50S ribosomal protein L13 [Chloroflexota bacterium]|nr:50S ribosomal protein L13 [Chloroflexota bacterium]